MIVGCPAFKGAPQLPKGSTTTVVCDIDRIEPNGDIGPVQAILLLALTRICIGRDLAFTSSEFGNGYISYRFRYDWLAEDNTVIGASGREILRVGDAARIGPASGIDH